MKYEYRFLIYEKDPAFCNPIRHIPIAFSFKLDYETLKGILQKYTEFKDFRGIYYQHTDHIIYIIIIYPILKDEYKAIYKMNVDLLVQYIVEDIKNVVR